jgi:acyl-CoA thioesterase-1
VRNDARLAKMYRKLYGKQPFSYVAFGDSHTDGGNAAGIGVLPRDQLNSAVNLLRRYIQTITPNVSFVNSGVGGNKTSDGMARVNADVVAYNPDLVTMEFGINDCWAGLGIATFRSNIQSLISTITGAGATLVLWSTSPVAHTSDPYGFGGTLRTDPPGSPYKDYRTVVAEEAANANLLYVDCWKVFHQQYNRGFTDVASYMFTDAAHPGELGHSMYFQTLKQGIFGTREI